jgi:hypothetical protein
MNELVKYRYKLEREINKDGNITIGFIGVNPSTADDYVDDNTVKNWKVFAKNNNAKKMLVANAFAFRATDVKNLSSAIDPIGKDNDASLLSFIKQCDVLVPCWGSRNKLRTKLRPRLDIVMTMLLESGKPIKVLGYTKTNDPRHPQGVSHKTKLITHIG